MKKGIVATILIYTMVLLTTLILMFYSVEYLKQYFSQTTVGYINISFSFFLTVLSFVLLGFRLNRKYNLTYSRFVIVGSLISILVSTIFTLLFPFIALSRYSLFKPMNWNIYLNDVIPNLHTIPKVAIIYTIVCSIVAIFHKKYKRRPKTNTESLDSNLIDN